MEIFRNLQKHLEKLLFTHRINLLKLFVNSDGLHALHIIVMYIYLLKYTCISKRKHREVQNISGYCDRIRVYIRTYICIRVCA